VDSGLQVQLEEDGDDGTRQSGVKTSGLWSVIHWNDTGLSVGLSVCLNVSQVVTVV